MFDPIIYTKPEVQKILKFFRTTFELDEDLSDAWVMEFAQRFVEWSEENQVFEQPDVEAVLFKKRESLFAYPWME